MLYKKIAFLSLGLGLISVANADVSTTLSAGTVACISRRDAQNYAVYAVQAPDFAKDMLDRAICYSVIKPEEAVRLGAEKGFIKLKLLSGHTVWVKEAVLK